jgi:hypothetical protein
MANVLAADKQRTALQMLVEGNSLRSVTRLKGIHRTAIMNLLVRFGDACRQFLDEEMRGLTLRHIQYDEIHIFVGKRQKHLGVDEKRERHDIGEVYLWTALDTDSKLIPTFIIGKRSADMAAAYGGPSKPTQHAASAGLEFARFRQRRPNLNGRILGLRGRDRLGVRPLCEVRHHRKGLSQRKHAARHVLASGDS